MANTVSPSRRPRGAIRWRAPSRGDVLTFLVAAILCYASYYLSIWHNSRGAADSRLVLGPSADAGGASPWPCGSDARAGAGYTDEPLDFEAHHTAENAGLSVSVSADETRTTTIARRALRGAVVWPGNPGRGAEDAAGARR